MPRKCCLPRQLSHPQHSFVSDGVDNEEGVTESESDDSEAQESAEHESDKDCEVIGGKETAIAHE